MLYLLCLLVLYITYCDLGKVLLIPTQRSSHPIYLNAIGESILINIFKALHLTQYLNLLGDLIFLSYFWEHSIYCLNYVEH